MSKHPSIMNFHITGFRSLDLQNLDFDDIGDLWDQINERMLTKEEQERVDCQELKLVVDDDLKISVGDLPENYQFKPDKNGWVSLEYSVALFSRPRDKYISEGFACMAFSLGVAVLIAFMCFIYDLPYNKVGITISTCLFAFGISWLPNIKF